jgi:hypothetical protein
MFCFGANTNFTAQTRIPGDHGCDVRLIAGLIRIMTGSGQENENRETAFPLSLELLPDSSPLLFFLPI